MYCLPNLLRIAVTRLLTKNKGRQCFLVEGCNMVIYYLIFGAKLDPLVVLLVGALELVGLAAGEID